MKQLIILITLIILSSCKHNLAANETAYIYENRTTGEILYCSNEYEHAPAEPQDFIPRGTASVNPNNIKLCELE